MELEPGMQLLGDLLTGSYLPIAGQGPLLLIQRPRVTYSQMHLWLISLRVQATWFLHELLAGRFTKSSVRNG